MDESKYEEQLEYFIKEYEKIPLNKRTQEQRIRFNLANKLLTLHSKGISLVEIHDAISCANIECWKDGQTLELTTTAKEASRKLKGLMNAYKSFMRTLPPLPCEKDDFEEHPMSAEVEETWQALRLHFIRGNSLFSEFQQAYRVAFGITMKPTKDPTRLTQCKLTIYSELSKYMQPSIARRETIKLINCAFPQLLSGDEKKAVVALERLIKRHKS